MVQWNLSTAVTHGLKNSWSYYQPLLPRVDRLQYLKLVFIHTLTLTLTLSNKLTLSPDLLNTRFNNDMTSDLHASHWSCLYTVF